MSETTTPEENEAAETENFESLMQNYDARIGDDLQIGDKVTGEIISIGDENVFLNTGTKMDGAVARTELLDENGELPYQVGDTLELYVTEIDDSGIQLSKALSGAGGLEMLREAHESNIPVQGKVRDVCKGGFHVDIFQRQAFCPVSHIDMKYVETPEDYVGQEFDFLVTRLESNGRNIVVSRRDLILQQRSAEKEEFLKELKEGALLDGRISSIMPYGAFVELFPGIEGMVHVSEMSWSRVEKPDDLVSKDEPVTVRVIGVEAGKKEGELKIALSMKQAGGNPWEQEPFPLEAGVKVSGKVTHLAAFGAFVEIAPGIEGLIHISEMSYKKRVAKPDEIVSPGDPVDVLIKDIDLNKRRISLSLRDVEGDPWGGVADRYPVGQRVDGTLEKKEKFGFFINLEPGVTALLPKSRISQAQDKAKFDKLKTGDTISLMVEQVQPAERKITLGVGKGGKSETRAGGSESDWKQFTKDRKGGGSLGSLGEKLQEAMNKKG